MATATSDDFLSGSGIGIQNGSAIAGTDYTAVSGIADSALNGPLAPARTIQASAPTA